MTKSISSRKPVRLGTPMSAPEARKCKWGYIFLVPWLLIFCIFYVYPLFYGIAISFTDFRLGDKNWIALGNYVKIFHDYAFWRSLLGTVCYSVIVIPIQVFVPLLAANVLRPHSNRVNSAVKMLVYLPGVICTVAQVIVWKFIFAPNTGIIAQALANVGVAGFSVFDKAIYSVPVMALLIAFTNMGSQLVIYCAAIGAIPETYYEAAELDGASRSEQFRKITMPMLHPTMVYVFVTSTISALQIFVVPQMLTSGGPNYTSSTLLLMIYNSAFNNHQFGYAAALGVILFAITAVVAFIQFRVTRREAIEY